MTSDPYEKSGASDTATQERAGDMASLLEESLESHTPQRGEIIEGTIMGWDREGALVDIGAKSEGIILRHEMQSLGGDPENKLSDGETVLVFVLQPESADGQILLSLDRARGERGWHVLQARFESGETFEAEVTGYNKGGLLVNVEGVNAFVPMSQVVGVRPDRGRDDGASSLAESVGRTLRLKVIEINRRRNRVILSERAALQEWRLAQKERLIQELREGDIRRGRITSVRNFGVFVDLGGADGLAHLSELSWERDKSPAELFQVGDEVDVYITKIDSENKKIALSLRRARPEQWDAVVEKYKEGTVVVGLITKLVTFGAFARIEGPVEGLIHVSELVDRRIGHPKEVVREGDLLPLKIVRIERDRHRLGLSLRRAREEGEGMGFVFSEGGEVLSVPDAIRDEFEAREGPIELLAPPPQDSADEEPPAIDGRAAQAEATAEEPAEATITKAPAAPPTVKEEPVPTPMAEAFASAAEALAEENAERAIAEGPAAAEAEAVAEPAPVELETADEPVAAIEAEAVAEPAPVELETADEPVAATEAEAVTEPAPLEPDTADEPVAATEAEAAVAEEAAPIAEASGEEEEAPAQL